MVEMELYEIRIDESHWHQPQVILLKEKNGNRILPIVIGLFEAQSIYIKVKNIPTLRPYSHDLLANMLTQLGGRLERIVIDDLKAETFYAKLFIHTQQGTELMIDSRPSDAIALALRSSAPIYVNEEVLDQVASED
ncbi:MAG: bifunctional nuclease family protein [bacterium]|nr:bifunctional nuclease family protein [bacterium]